MLTNLKIDPKQLPKRVIVCGDPKRAALIASKLGNQRQLAENREYHSYAGEWKGVEVAIVSHGVGSPGAAVCFEELAKGGVEVIIRVGTAGSYQQAIQPGSLVISSAAVRQDGLTSQLVPPGFPAVADRRVAEALVEAAQSSDSGLHIAEGITLTLDVFYNGVLEFPHKLYQKAGVLAVEMENSALFVIAALRGMKAGSILAIDGFADADLLADYNPHTETLAKAIEVEALIALDAVVVI
ncbi:nucleoside phosphorylase [Brevibacillus choshinensis]|uniref:nucleoside phosphorylase n=1 Tax=Brevibacillus choshinensis TaxID=54911 RepID=UPI002E22F015|nr:nucleoside phosphorylase [Brevibacillus choshinensis]MED4780197.1 nucleoside phosphorylase [Brevibacillus choshinensis]